jgi:hypothetical protein
MTEYVPLNLMAVLKSIQFCCIHEEPEPSVSTTVHNEYNNPCRAQCRASLRGVAYPEKKDETK